MHAVAKRRLSKLSLVLVAIIWGSGFVASALAIEHYTTYQILALRFSLASLVLTLLFPRRVVKTPATVMKQGAILGLIVFLAFSLQTTALLYTTASKNAFLTAVNIVFVPFLGWFFFRQPIQWKALIGAVVTFMGVGFMSLTEGIGAVNLGDLLTLGCAVFFGLQLIFTDHYVKDSDPVQLLVAQLAVAALLSWIMVLVRVETNFVFWSAQIYPVVYLGLVSTLLAYFIQTVAQQYTLPTETAVILSTESFFGMLASALILGEDVTANTMIGAILIFVGILIVEVDPRALRSSRFKQ